MRNYIKALKYHSFNIIVSGCLQNNENVIFCFQKFFFAREELFFKKYQF